MYKRRRTETSVVGGSLGSQGWSSARGRSKSRPLLTYRGVGVPSVPRAPRVAPFPAPMATAKLRYCDTMNFTQVAAGVLVSTAWKANGLFDPYAPLGGHQPYGFDTLASLYGNYQVLSSKCKVTCGALGTAGSAQCIFGVVMQAENGFLSTSARDIIEEGRGEYKICTAQNQGKTIVSKFVAKDQYPGAGASASGLSLIAGDPADPYYFNVWVVHPDQTILPTNSVPLVIDIEYTAIFWNPKELPES